MTERFRPDYPTGPVVVGVDGSRFSRGALRWAIEHGRRTDTLVVALMCWHLDPVTRIGRPVVTGVPAHPRQAPEARFQQFLDDTVRAVLADTGGPTPLTRVMPGSPADVLVDASRDAGLLVLGGHGHGRLFDAVLGSVADHCARHARCPVVIIPAALADAGPDRRPVTVPADFLPDRYGWRPL